MGYKNYRYIKMSVLSEIERTIHIQNHDDSITTCIKSIVNCMYYTVQSFVVLSVLTVYTLTFAHLTASALSNDGGQLVAILSNMFLTSAPIITAGIAALSLTYGILRTSAIIMKKDHIITQNLTDKLPSLTQIGYALLTILVVLIAKKNENTFPNREKPRKDNKTKSETLPIKDITPLVKTHVNKNMLERKYGKNIADKILEKIEHITEEAWSCPIEQVLFNCPVIAKPTSSRYEKNTITRYFEENHDRDSIEDPMTGSTIYKSLLTVDKDLIIRINEVIRDITDNQKAGIPHYIDKKNGQLIEVDFSDLITSEQSNNNQTVSTPQHFKFYHGPRVKPVITNHYHDDGIIRDGTYTPKHIHLSKEQREAFHENLEKLDCETFKICPITLQLIQIPVQITTSNPTNTATKYTHLMDITTIYGLLGRNINPYQKERILTLMNNNHGTTIVDINNRCFRTLNRPQVYKNPLNNLPIEHLVIDKKYIEDANRAIHELFDDGETTINGRKIPVASLIEGYQYQPDCFVNYNPEKNMSETQILELQKRLEDIFPQWVCPISKKIPEKPCKLLSKQEQNCIYEQACIEAHIQEHQTDPKYGEEISKELIVPDYETIKLINKTVQTILDNGSLTVESCSPQKTKKTIDFMNIIELARSTTLAY